jgi:hypothetical protein
MKLPLIFNDSEALWMVLKFFVGLLRPYKHADTREVLLVHRLLQSHPLRGFSIYLYRLTCRVTRL